jgi:hypothetical protein
MLLAGSTRYLSIHEAEGGWLLTAHPPTLPNSTSSRVFLPRCLSHGACHRTSFQSNSLSARTLPGNPIPRTDNRNPLRLNTGREYTSQPYTRNPLSLLRRRRESHQHSYPPGACLPAEAQTPLHCAESSSLYTDIKTPERAKQRAVPSSV